VQVTTRQATRVKAEPVGGEAGAVLKRPARQSTVAEMAEASLALYHLG